MSNCTFHKTFITKPIDSIVEHILSSLQESTTFTGVGQRKKYNIIRVNPTAIFYSGKDRNQGDPEAIPVKDLSIVLEQLKHLSIFNTNSSQLKEKMPQGLYRKRTPLFAILSHTGIIHEV